jgi:arsenate reductase (glutaredoxin)
MRSARPPGRPAGADHLLPAMLTLYGIPNCDTVRKARAFLDARGTAYRFHDFKRDGLSRGLLEDWCDSFGWERVLNRAGASFRQLDPARREGLDRERAIALMLAQPSMVRRPVLERETLRLIGFDPLTWEDSLR